MSLHHALRELVTQLGPSVLNDADVLRGALDDYLAEGDAGPAEIRMLADGVRDGGLARLVDLLDNGAEQPVAVRTAGAVVSEGR